MPIFTEIPPLSLYVHLPWCVQKCPYCDFNSHAIKDILPEDQYVSALLQEFENHLEKISARPLVSIFFGGGTPSLFSGEAIHRILSGIARHVSIEQIEITLEANPGTVDYARFRDFRSAGINRLSLGVQSLQDDKLKTLGRIHNQENAKRAISCAKEAGFTNFNIDLMYGLPNQSIDDALHDIKTALSFAPTHLSWYQLTIEPNTFFYHHTPSLPADDVIWDMQLAGQELIQQSGLVQYEVSAYAKPEKTCRHNLNYWEFGDYLGIGAGAHSKITDMKTGFASRFSQIKNPRDYLNQAQRQIANTKIITTNDLMFEFMLNALRLTQGVSSTLFAQRTGLPLEAISAKLQTAKERKLLLDDPSRMIPTELGRKFLNDLTEIFLPE